MTNKLPKPFGHQQDAIKQITNKNIRCVFTPYGSGKSRIALQVFINGGGKVGLILCKKRNVITWLKEIEKYSPSADVVVVAGSKSTREETINEIKHLKLRPLLLILTYSLLDTVIGKMITARLPLSLIIADESTVIKNPKARVTKNALSLSYHYPQAIKLCLSGNPVPEGWHEIWSQMVFGYGTVAMQWWLPSTYYQFLRRYFVISNFKASIDIEKKQYLIDKVLDHSFLLSPAQYNKLRDNYPKERWMIEYYQLSNKQKALIKQLVSDWELPAGDSVEQYSWIMQIMNKRQQISSGFYYTNGQSPNNKPTQKCKTTTTFNSNTSKTKLVGEIVADLLTENKNTKIVIWRKFVAEDAILQKKLQSIIGNRWLIGPSADCLLNFAKPQYSVIVMPLGTTQGFNELAIASINIFYSNDYSLEKRMQAESRLSRLNQKSKVVTHIDLCSANHIDYEIIVALQNKQLTPNKVVEIFTKSLKTK